LLEVLFRVVTERNRVMRAVRRSAPAPRPGVVDVCAALAGLGFGAVLAAVITGESAGALRAPGGLLTAGGRFAGFTGTYLMLIMVVLVARLPWLERAAGQDRLVRWHRRVSPWALGLIAAHVVLITLGYAQAARSGTLREVWVLLTSYPDMLAAFVGFFLLMLAGVTSVRIARQRLRYETWWVVHLYLYLGLALASLHQIADGVSFIGHPLVRDLWIMIWVATAGMVVLFRVLLPIGRSVRHQLRVVAVRPEAPGVVSVICQGRRLDRLPVSGGQFFLWRFLTRDLWWQAHPYSLSALPSGQYLRITIKGLGDQSRAVAGLGRVPRSLSRARTARSPAMPADRRRSCWSAPGWASRRCARCWRTCRTGRTWWWCCARRPLTASSTAGRLPSWCTSVAADSTRWSARDTGCGSTRTRYLGSCPTFPPVTSTFAGRAGSAPRSPGSPEDCGCPASRSTSRRSGSRRQL
jgi:hypothetical protein